MAGFLRGITLATDMTEDSGTGKGDRRKAREARLAEALRLNLRRRKASGAAAERPAEAEKRKESGAESGVGERS